MALSGKQRDIEPITAISVVIFLLAAVAVGSLSVYNNYFADNDSAVAAGSTVSVDYTGSFYFYYDEDGALIFDTNVEAHNDADKYNLLGEFSKTSFKELSFVQGNGEVLRGFENAVLGKKVGETVRVMIEANTDLYESEYYMISDTYEFNRVSYMELKTFNKIYEDVTVAEGAGKVTFTTVYGWEATAIYDSSMEKVKIENSVASGESYELTSNEGQIGKVILEVTTIEDGKIKCVMSVESEKEDYMLYVDLGYETFYLFGLDEAKGELKVTQNPAYEEDLYFVITIKSIY